MELPFIGTLYSLLTGLSFACFYVLNKKASHSGSPLLVIMWVFATQLPFFLLWLVVKPAAHISPEYFVPGMAVMLLTIGGNLLTIRALSLSPFSLMVPVLGLSPVFTSLISIPLLGEWPSSQQQLCAKVVYGRV